MYKVKNLKNTTQSIRAANGDTVQFGPKAEKKVADRFVEFRKLNRQIFKVKTL